MVKLHHLYLVIFLLLLSFTGTQAAERITLVSPSVNIEAGNNETSLFVLQSGQNILTALPLADALTTRTPSIGQLRLPGIKGWKSASYFRQQDTKGFSSSFYRDDITYIQILSTRHSDGFYIYFLKKITI